jgi:hypothetical protein
MDTVRLNRDTVEERIREEELKQAKIEAHRRRVISESRESNKIQIIALNKAKGEMLGV